MALPTRLPKLLLSEVHLAWHAERCKMMTGPGQRNGGARRIA
jgi:hypothetical protein